MTAKRFTPSQSIIEGTCVDSNQKSPSAYTGRQRAPRYGFVASIEVLDLESDIRLQERTADLSLYGCCVAAAAQKSFLTGTRVRIRIVHGGAKFAAIGRVAYSNSDGEMGIAFVRIEENDQATLEKWISELREAKA